MIQKCAGAFAALLSLAALCAPSSASAQDLNAGGRLRLSALASVGAECGSSLSQPGLQQGLEAELQAHGIPLSNAHTARLGVEIECMRAPEAAEIAIHQCLDLKELVSRDSGRPALASTWRKCQSFACRGGACKKGVDSRLQSLVDAFGDEMQTGSKYAAVVVVAPRNGSQMARGSNRVSAEPPRDMKRVAFFSLYILMCLSVLVKWQLRTQYR